MITIEAAHTMGANGAAPTEAERLLFEAWMRGHCWDYADTWDGTRYQDHDVYIQDKRLDPLAMQTRRLWAAWRDRAALATPDWQEVTESLLSDLPRDPMYWIALTNGTVTHGTYEWRQGRKPDRFILPGDGDIWAFEASHICKFSPPPPPKEPS